MDLSAVLTVLAALIFFSFFTMTRSTTITRTFEGDEPRESALDSVYEYFERTQDRQPERVADDCPDCVRKELEARISKEEMDRQRIEFIKQQILRKLHMDKPPNITSPILDLPDPISLDETLIRRDEPAEDSTSEIYVFPEEVNANCFSILPRPVACFNFYFDTKIHHYSVNAAELWVYKLPDISDDERNNQTLVLRETTSPGRRLNRKADELARIQTTVRQGWVKFDLKGPVYRWLRHSRRRTKGLKIICETCENVPEEMPVGSLGQHKPFFKISLERSSRSRTRRNTAICGPTVTSCCVEELYVDFRAIGWHWITSPRGYYANYCRGSCRELTGVHQWHVSRVLTQVAAHTTSPDMKTHLNACCAPTSATALNLIYYDRDGSNNLIRRTLQNMIINSCGCL